MAIIHYSLFIIYVAVVGDKEYNRDKEKEYVTEKRECDAKELWILSAPIHVIFAFLTTQDKEKQKS